jgi:hypothetical protein
MFDFLRNISKPEEEKRREQLNAYLDGALSLQEQRRLEEDLKRDAALRAELEQLRWVKSSVQRLPRVRAPRNFILDPAIYGKRASPRSGKAAGRWQPYPALRLATALTAFFFVLALALDVATPYGAITRPLIGGAQAPAAAEETLRAADEVSMLAQGERSVEEPAGQESAAQEVPEEGAAEPAPLAATGEQPAAEMAAEAAEQAAEEAAEEPVTGGDAFGDVSEEGIENEPEEQPAPRTAAPAAAAGESTMEATEAAEIGAPGPQATPTALAAATSTPPVTEPEISAAEIQEQATGSATESAIESMTEPATEPAPAPFPYLLLIEISLGAALVALAVVMLLARRGM